MKKLRGIMTMWNTAENTSPSPKTPLHLLPNHATVALRIIASTFFSSAVIFESYGCKQGGI